MFLFYKYFPHSFFDAIIMVGPVIMGGVPAEFWFMWLS
jgi:hypothetical protein